MDLSFLSLSLSLTECVSFKISRYWQRFETVVQTQQPAVAATRWNCREWSGVVHAGCTGYKISGIVCSEGSARRVFCKRQAQRSDASRLLCAAFIRIERRSCRMQKRRISKVLSLQGPRGHSRLSQRPADLWESVRVWL